MYVVTGELLIRDRTAIELTTVASGYVSIIAPTSRNDITFEGNQTSEVYVLEFGLLPGVADTANNQPLFPCTAYVANREGMLDFFRQYLREAQSFPPSTEILDCIASAILSLVAQSMHVQPPTEQSACSSYSEVIATKVDSYIAANFTLTIDTVDIAQLFCYNVEYLEKTYHHVRGMSIISAVQQRRIHAASALLADNNSISIKEVAKVCGYSDRKRFTKEFKRFMGMTPTEFCLTTRAVQ